MQNKIFSEDRLTSKLRNSTEPVVGQSVGVRLPSTTSGASLGMSEYWPMRSADTIRFSTWQARNTTADRHEFKANPYVKDRPTSSATQRQKKTGNNVSLRLKKVPNWIEFQELSLQGLGIEKNQV
jgi:hypothetical protein